MARLSREEKEFLKEQKRKKRKKILLIVAIVLAIIAVIAGFFGFAKYFCELTDVAIEGVKKSDAGDVADAVLGGRFNDNTMFIFLDLGIEKPKHPEFVEKMDIRMTGLHSLEVDVTEKQTNMYFKDSEGNFVYSDAQGIVTQVSDRLILGAMPCDGIELDEVVEGEKMPIPGRELNLLVDTLTYLKKGGIEPKAAHFDEKGYLSLDLETYNLFVGNDVLLYDKLSRLEYIFPSIEGMTGTLHLENFNNDSKDIAFEKDEAQVAKEKAEKEGNN